MTESVGKPVKKQVFIGDNLFKIPQTPGESPRLIGSKCLACGEVVFPRKTRCPNCCSDRVEEILIGPVGKLYSFTVIYGVGPIGYRGPVPYGVVKVEMPEGLRITGYSTQNDPAKLSVGMEMELIIDKLFDDEEGNEVITTNTKYEH
jgi:uncharacterized OB-fold protein